jgi:hypothetical protein
MPMFNQGRDFNFQARRDIIFNDVAGNLTFNDVAGTLIFNDVLGDLNIDSSEYTLKTWFKY